ncbi:MAG: hypothetical protein K5672_08860 [Bacteroidaceae bacterium]|nr:hypothetical protein [Bacteroidaceae bacterium]
MKQRLLYGFLLLLVCLTGSMRVWALEQNDEGVYQIGTPQDLVDFAALVNGGETGAKAVLTANINLSSVLTDETPWVPIGNAEAQFAGTFDGQGFSITNFAYVATGDDNGLFGYIKDATVKNFSITGTLTSTFTKNGVIGHADGAALVSGIHSALDMTISGNAHSGGIVGGTETTSCTLVIENCEYSGTMTHSGEGDCQAGILGYTYYGGVKNCIFSGTINGENNKYGGILGYCKVAEFGGVQNCLSIGKIVAEEGCTTAAAIIANWNGGATPNVKNNYYCLQEGSTTTIAIGNKASNCEAPVAVTPEQLASGEVCFLLNGKQTENVAFYQTLPTDKLPLFDASHGVVYQNGRLHCNGDAYEDVVYSNENTGITRDDHNIVDGFCSYCGLFDENYLTPNADGFYEIADGKQLGWFQQKVNNGEYGANAVLTANIDLNNEAWTPIGNATNPYTGTFDGKGYKISGFNATSTGNNGGFFGKISAATIKNFSIDGSFAIEDGKYNGVIAQCVNSTVSNVCSSLEISVTGANASHMGGVVGSTEDGTGSTISNCVFSGSITMAADLKGSIAGVVGYMGPDKIINCANFGSITYEAEGCNAGGIVAYVNNNNATVKNCLNVGVIKCNGESPTYGGAIIGRIKKNYNTTKILNNYWLEGSATGAAKKDSDPTFSLPTSSAASVTDYELASGEIAWKLNEETFLDAVWRQEIEEDDYPLPTGIGALVYQTPGGYESVSENKPESFEPFREVVIANETEFIEDEELVAYNTLVIEYTEAIKSWEAIDNLTAFLEAYKVGAQIKKAIKSSAAKYADYKKTCEAAVKYIQDNSLEGTWTEFLQDYLEGNVEPCQSYPNGSYSYIMENLNLDDEALTAEIDFVGQMLQNAIAGGVTPGTEITRLIVNPTFTQGEDKFEGWNKEAGEGATFATGGVAEVMNIARGKDGTFDINQTVSNLENGIYMMSLNGLFLDGQDIYSQLYGGQVYLNNTYNYVMTSGEDIISVEDTTNYVNCLIGNDSEYLDGAEVVGLVPSSFNGCSYAFDFGRYQNFCAAEVTDGTLTIGMRNLGASGTGDWMPFGNLHVYYLGTPAEANEKLTEVLEGFAARAQVIVDFVASDGYSDFEKKPNISVELKGRLIAAIAAADAAATGEEKMALINTFSTLFNEVHACRQAYIAMAKACEPAVDILSTLIALGIIDEDEYNDMEDYVYAAIEHFAIGDVSAEEALAITEKLSILDKYMPNVDGVYQISNAIQLQLFAAFVNSGQADINAVLASDIDMTDVEMVEPIGSSASAPFSGVFDGQGYAIKNFVYKATHDNNGLFGYIENATVKNFGISGILTSDGYNYNGVVGQAEGTSVVSGVHSSMDVNVANCKAHTGGIVGGCSTSSKILVEGCEYSGTLTHSGSGDCQAGIIGYTYAGGVKNCIFSGTIIGQNSKYGGILGYCKVPGFQGVQNCLSIGKIIANDNCTTAAAIIANWNGGNTANVKNNYYCLQDGSTTTIAIGNKASNCEAPIAVTPEQLASGEVCFKLNGDAEVPAWYQTLGLDATPVLDKTHLVVLYDEIKGYYNEEEDPNGIANVNVNDNVNKTGIYNLAGQRLSKLQKGINIVGGKKILF